MEIKDLFSELVQEFDAEGSRGYHSLVAFILDILRFRAHKEGKPFVTERIEKSYFDAFASEGLLGIEGPVLIEIKVNASINVMRRYFSSSNLEQELKGYRNKGATLLIISAAAIRSETLEYINKNIAPLYPWLKIVFWGRERVSEIVNLDNKYASLTSKKLFSIRIKNALSQNKNEWKDKREYILSELKSFYHKGQFSLFLGAGVSSSAGMPDWDTLLNSLFVSYLSIELESSPTWSEDEIKELVERLSHFDERSALVSARYLRKGFLKSVTEDKRFRDEITKSLYALRNKNKSIDSDLIKQISLMCMPRRTGAKVQSVYTYNFDDLVERKLKELSIAHKSIYSGTGNHLPEELPVYHVHGFLPEDTDEYDNVQNSTLVFAEEGYHQVYSDPYHWSNLVQLNGLQGNTCLMVGLSMADPNLRRLLDISARNTERTSHFAFMKRITDESFCYDTDKDGKKHKAISNIKSGSVFLQHHHALNEELMKELGVKVIWYEKYEEIPEMLGSITTY